MKPIRLLMSALVLTSLACGKNVNRQIQEAVANFDGAQLPAEAVEVVETRQFGDEAVAEVKVRTAFRLRKLESGWVVQEVRLGDRKWEKAEVILNALQVERVSSTEASMVKIHQALDRYISAHGQVPQSGNFEGLIDVLSPEFLEEVVRWDAWSQPFIYKALSETSYELRSLGPDGALETNDDLVARRLR